MHQVCRALDEMEIDGIATTIPAHKALVSHPDFAAAHHSTKWVEEDFDANFGAASRPRARQTLRNALTPRPDAGAVRVLRTAAASSLCQG